MFTFKTSRKGFTLIEILFVAVITLLCSLAILGGLYFVDGAQRYARQRIYAQQIAQNMLEAARQTAFSDLKSYTKEVVVDDNRTPSDPSDDVKGNSSLTLYAYPGGPGNEIADTTGVGYVIAEASVSWVMGGDTRTSDTARRVSLMTQLAP